MNMKAPLLLGDLLRAAQIISLNDMTHAIQVSTTAGLPVGRVLVMLGLVKDELVSAALEAQSQVRERLISKELAVQALKVCAARRLNFSEAVGWLGHSDQAEETTNKLGSILIGAGLIKTEAIREALKTSQHLNLPLGRILVLRGLISQRVLEVALNTQVLLRDGRICKEDAYAALKKSAASPAELENAQAVLNSAVKTHRHTIRLGELLVLATVLSDSDLLTALEFAMDTGTMLGEALVNLNFVDQDVIFAALQLQQLITNRGVSGRQAAAVLRQVKEEGLSVAKALNRLTDIYSAKSRSLGLLELLKLSGLISPFDADLLKPYAENGTLEQVLRQHRLINDPTLHVAVRCQLLLCEGLLTPEQAIVALHCWRWSGINLEDIVLEMGWKREHQSIFAPCTVVTPQGAVQVPQNIQ